MNKFHSRKTPCLSKHMHDSKFEAICCNGLLADLQSGKIQSYEIQKKFDLVVHGVKVCSHYVDFLVINNNGNPEVHEAKGKRTDAWSIKHKLFCALYPLIPYKIKQKKGWDTCQKKRQRRKKLNLSK